MLYTVDVTERALFPRDNQPVLLSKVKTNNAVFALHCDWNRAGTFYFSLIPTGNTTVWTSAVLLSQHVQFADMDTVMPYDRPFLFINVLTLTM